MCGATRRMQHNIHPDFSTLSTIFPHIIYLTSFFAPLGTDSSPLHDFALPFSFAFNFTGRRWGGGGGTCSRKGSRTDSRSSESRKNQAIAEDSGMYRPPGELTRALTCILS